ncbi:MAG: copper chaperone PCu(A)C, partial [Vicinamibacterales bacterium]
RRRAILAGLAACTALLLSTPHTLQAQTASVVASDPWVREPLASAAQTAVFVVLENKSAETRQLVSASTTAAEKTELHTMSMTNGMMRMEQVKSIELKANAKTELKPGGFHIMLFGLKEHPASGASVALTLTLDNGQTIPVTATVRKPEGMK